MNDGEARTARARKLQWQPEEERPILTWKDFSDNMVGKKLRINLPAEYGYESYEASLKKETKAMLAASSVKNRRPVEMNGMDHVGCTVPMYQVPWGVFADLNWAVTGTPVLFAMHEDQLWFWPTPVGDGSYFTVTVGQGSGE